MTPTTINPIELSPSELLTIFENQEKIKTGSNNLDNLIGGGVEFGKITEVSGPFASGKTNLAMSVLISMHQQNPSFKAIVIDTENKFDLRKLKNFAETRNVDPYKLFLNLKFIRVSNIEEQAAAINQIPRLIENDSDYKLVIVDSMTSLLRSELAGRALLVKRQEVLGKMIFLLNVISAKKDIAILITNQITTIPDSNSKKTVIPLGGNYIAHHSHIRLLLRHGPKGKNIAELIHSTYLPHGETNFLITSKGIIDP